MDYGLASDINNFFYAGKVDLDTQIQSEVLQAVLQPKRSMFYNRSYGAGITEYENYPMTANIKIFIAYDVVRALAIRNSKVPNGNGDYPDRRVAVSQNNIIVKIENESINLSVYYVPMYNIKASRILTIPMGVNS